MIITDKRIKEWRNEFSDLKAGQIFQFKESSEAFQDDEYTSIYLFFEEFIWDLQNNIAYYSEGTDAYYHDPIDILDTELIIKGTK